MIGLGDKEVAYFAPLLDGNRRDGARERAHTRSLCVRMGRSRAAAGFRSPRRATHRRRRRSRAAIDPSRKAVHEGAKYCRSLYLNHNKITDKGIKTLVDALIGNSTLTELYLQYNKLEDAGAKHIGRLLQYNRRLKKLDVGANGIGEPGVSDIIDGLQDNGTIESVGLFGNAPAINDDLAEVASRLKPEARIQRQIGIQARAATALRARPAALARAQPAHTRAHTPVSAARARACAQVKNKFREKIEQKLASENRTKESLPRPWEESIWESISDEISHFFSNTAAEEGEPTARRLLHVPRLESERGSVTLSGVAGEGNVTVQPRKPGESVYFRLLGGNMGKTEGSASEIEVEVREPSSGRLLKGRVSAQDKGKLTGYATSLVTFLDPMTMFPTKPRFRGAGFVDEAGAQYICCAGPKGTPDGACPYRPRYRNDYPVRLGEQEVAGTYTLERDRETGRFFLQGYDECLRIEEAGSSAAAASTGGKAGGGGGGGAKGAAGGGAAAGVGMPKHIAREPKVDKVIVTRLDGQDNCVDDQGVAFTMGFTEKQRKVLEEGGINAMHIRAVAPHPHFVPWRVAHVEHSVEAIAEEWADVRACARGARPARRGCAEGIGRARCPPPRAQAFVRSEYSKLTSEAEPFSPFNVVSKEGGRKALAELLVGVTAKEKGNVRFVCEKCYDSYIMSPPPRSSKVPGGIFI